MFNKLLISALLLSSTPTLSSHRKPAFDFYETIEAPFELCFSPWKDKRAFYDNYGLNIYRYGQNLIINKYPGLFELLTRYGATIINSSSITFKEEISMRKFIRIITEFIAIKSGTEEE